jgi:hypothetical protein
MPRQSAGVSAEKPKITSLGLTVTITHLPAGPRCFAVQRRLSCTEGNDDGVAMHLSAGPTTRPMMPILVNPSFTRADEQPPSAKATPSSPKPASSRRRARGNTGLA